METDGLNKIVIFGVGLIGGSFALGLRQANQVKEVVGFGRSEETLQQAVELGIIHRVGKDIAAEVADADLILLATPVGQMPAIMRQIAPHLTDGVLITDGGSTKSDVVAAAQAAFGERIKQFIPAHPIAGSEHSGAAAAKADLYQGKRVVLTPLPENSAEDIAKVHAAWAACGAEIYQLRPSEHDQVFAAVSHLPHVLAFTLVYDISKHDNCDTLMAYAASGFRDFTRIAASSPEMWRDICLANQPAILSELNSYIAELNRIKAQLEQNDSEALEQVFRTAQNLRVDWQPQK